MKKTIIVPLLSILITFCGLINARGDSGVERVKSIERTSKKRNNSSSEPASRMEFSFTEYDFKQVRESGERVSCDFVVTNTGTCPLILTRAIVSCRCVNVSFSKRPIPVGGQGVIEVTYNPRKQQGILYKAIQIFSNTPEKMHVITLRGEVIP